MSFLMQDALEKYRLLLDENPMVVRRLSNRIVASYLEYFTGDLEPFKVKALNLNWPMQFFDV
ncbi:hypothetical protein [Sphingobacterium sp. UGAL515B_05]|uniref:hypothetical protein n=1 Tax=Sphingobacterium sp. UGAL515B_05 TaxID=2986767 RepID=UPI002952CB28|nr:hypothetical protein [Sphingobacterium sp. UGAL515B_05]WON93941.1 hypothetical protein OK025_22175 [Sphingobacterium sp. UGAL515B_05]